MKLGWHCWDSYSKKRKKKKHFPQTPLPYFANTRPLEPRIGKQKSRAKKDALLPEECLLLPAVLHWPRTSQSIWACTALTSPGDRCTLKSSWALVWFILYCVKQYFSSCAMPWEIITLYKQHLTQSCRLTLYLVHVNSTKCLRQLMRPSQTNN